MSSALALACRLLGLHHLRRLNRDGAACSQVVLGANSVGVRVRARLRPVTLPVSGRENFWGDCVCVEKKLLWGSDFCLFGTKNKLNKVIILWTSFKGFSDVMRNEKTKKMS